jgi:hypothetical protein
MLQFYEKINWSIDIESLYDKLSSVGVGRSYSNNLQIFVEDSLKLIPQLSELVSIVKHDGITLSGTDIITTKKFVFGRIHIDYGIEVRLNFPLLNSDRMITRWYNITETPEGNLTKPFLPLFRTNVDYWLNQNAKKLVSENCVETLIMDTPAFIKTDEPHNVDGSCSPVDRYIFSTTWKYIDSDQTLRWSNRHFISDAIKKIV